MSEHVRPDVNPFATPEPLKAPARRLRGRIAAGVTIWTAGGAEERAGLTVSSVLVAEGDPPLVAGLIGDLTDLWEAIHASERFVVHVLDDAGETLSDVFAGLRPSPGGPFAGLEVSDSDYGPVLPFVATRAYCSLLDSQPTGYHQLLRGAVERFEIGELDSPLVYFRGAYRRLSPRPR